MNTSGYTIGGEGEVNIRLRWTPSFGQDRSYAKRGSRCPQGILVGVKDIWPTLPERLLQSFDTEVGLQGL